MDGETNLAAELDPAARMDLLQLSAVEPRISELFGSPMDLFALKNRKAAGGCRAAHAF